MLTLFYVLLHEGYDYCIFGGRDRVESEVTEGENIRYCIGGRDQVESEVIEGGNIALNNV